MPSWVVSLALHVVLLCLMGQTLWRPTGFGGRGAGDNEIGSIFAPLNGSGSGLPGEGTGQPRGDGIGIYPGPQEGGHDAGEAGQSPDQTAEATLGTGRPQSANARANREEDAPPVDLDLPSSPTLTGVRPAAANFRTQSGDARQMIKANGRGLLSQSGGSSGGGDGSGPGGGGGGGTGGNGGAGGQGNGQGGGTSFFGHRATGKRFLYVLDASGSMYDYNAIAVAKAELLASLAQLDDTQQFQVIFYNEHCHPMPNLDRKDSLFWGTDTNRTRASQFVRGIDPEGGTRHLDALLMALSYAPDVLFFLTDAGEPILYPADLDKIKRRNSGRTTIFTIEFGKGPNLRIDNFLKKLARDNGGAHAYRDVQEFQRR
jgi:hypothetical protein